MTKTREILRIAALLALGVGGVQAPGVQFLPGLNIGFPPGVSGDVVTWQGETLVMLVSFDGGPLCWFAPYAYTENGGVELEIVEWGVLGGCVGATAYLHSRQDERAGHKSVYSDSVVNGGLLTRRVPATRTVARHSRGQHENDLVIDFCVPYPCEFVCPPYVTAILARVRILRY